MNEWVMSEWEAHSASTIRAHTHHHHFLDIKWERKEENLGSAYHFISQTHRRDDCCASPSIFCAHGSCRCCNNVCFVSAIHPFSPIYCVYGASDKTKKIEQKRWREKEEERVALLFPKATATMTAAAAVWVDGCVSADSATVVVLGWVTQRRRPMTPRYKKGRKCLCLILDIISSFFNRKNK